MRRAIVVIALCALVAGCKLKPHGLPDGGERGDGSSSSTGCGLVSGSGCHAVTPASCECELAASAHLLSGRTAATSVTIGSKLIIVGGQAGGGALTGDTLGTVVGSDGTPGAWKSEPIPTPHANAAVAAVGSNVYIFGGEAGMAGSSDVFVGHVADDASVTYEATTALPATRTQAGAAGSDSHAYLVGGKSDLSAAYDGQVLEVSVDAEGLVTGYAAATPLPEPRLRPSAVVLNGYLYVVGGLFTGAADTCAKDQVLFAKVNDDGSLGAWTATTSVGTQPIGAVLVAGANRLYLVGGTGKYGDTAKDATGSVVDVGSVLEAEAKSDGTLGAWTRVGYLPDQRYGHVAAIINSKLLVFGGLIDSTQVLGDGYLATVNGDGSLSCP